jgi:hypothetical protein
MAITVSAGRFA